MPDNWQQNKHRRAALLIWLGIHVDISTSDLVSLSDGVLNLIYDIVKSDDIQEMDLFFDNLPPLDYLNFWKQNIAGYPSCGQVDQSHSKQMIDSRCVFQDILSVFSKYKLFVKNKVKSKRVKTNQKGDVILKLIKWNTIKEHSTKMTLDIKARLSELSAEIKKFFGKSLTQRFNALGKQMKVMEKLRRRSLHKWKIKRF